MDVEFFAPQMSRIDAKRSTFRLIAFKSVWIIVGTHFSCYENKLIPYGQLALSHCSRTCNLVATGVFCIPFRKSYSHFISHRDNSDPIPRHTRIQQKLNWN